MYISSANLSNDYFTNRQDRYVLIENCPELADFYDGLISQVGNFSFKLDKANQVHLHSGWSLHPATSDVGTFVKEARARIVSYYEDCRRDNRTRLEEFYRESSSSQRQRMGSSQSASSRSTSSEGSSHNEKDTWIFPLIQMGPFHISYDDQAISKIFEDTAPGSTIKLATGYFNLTGDYVEKIIQKSASNYEILMAHPKVSSFSRLPKSFYIGPF
jgi:CDP-diacylglycerol--glycerol-3-phosphate 3-phosphatidyltransferase